jgi:Flp pilus assembly protein TadD
MARKKRKSNPDSHPDQRKLLLGLAIFAFLLYAATVTFGYAVDDKIYVTGNEFVQQGFSGIPKILSTELFTGYFGDERARVAGGRYRPLALITFAIEYQLFGHAPWFGHLVNALLYAGCCVLLLLLLQRLLPDKPLALFAVLLWAAHPLHTEVVANIKSRDELLSLLAALGALLYMLRHIDSGERKFAIIAGLAFFASLMAKEATVTFVVLAPLAVFVFTDTPWRRNLIATTPLAIAFVVYLIIRLAVVGIQQDIANQELMNDPFLNSSASERYATVFHTMGLYLKLLVFPHPLTHDYYPFQIPIIGWGDWRALLSLLLYIALGIGAVIGLRRRHVVGYAIAFYLLSFSITSNLVFPIGTFMNERFMFVPSIGFCLALAWGLQRVPARALPATLGILLFAYSAKTIHRSLAWRNDYTLTMTDRKISTNSARIHMTAGSAAVDEAKKLGGAAREATMQIAFESFHRAIELYPTYTPAIFGLGTAYYENGDTHAAIAEFANCLKLRPHMRTAMQNINHIREQAEASGDLATAKLVYQAFIEIPEHAVFGNLRLGQMAARAEDFASAEHHFQAALAQAPENPHVHNDLGALRVGQGRMADAAACFDRAAALMPTNPEFLQRAAVAWQQAGNAAKAAEARRRLAALSAQHD